MISEVFFPENRKIYLRPGPTDMRKSMGTLSVLVQESMGQSPFSDSYFLFCNRSGSLIKILYWHKNGFALWSKRLDRHRFYWPRDEKECMELTEKKLIMLLSGIDFRNEHTEFMREKAG